MTLHPGGAGHARWAAAQGAAPAFDVALLAVAGALEQDAALALRAHELASIAPQLPLVERRDVALLVLLLLVSVARGSTRLGVHDGGAGELVGLLRELDGVLGAEQRARVKAFAQRLGDPAVAATLAPLLVSAGESGPVVSFGGHLYPQRLFETEGRIATAVGERLRARLPGDAGVMDAERAAKSELALDRALRDVLAAPPFAGERAIRLSREQEGAVRVAAQARLALVSGGPGTGKTSIVVSLLRVLVRLGYDAEADVALAAPTGKAADRMRVSVARALRALRAPTFDDAALLRAPPRSQTLHRLLGYSPRSGRYRAHERSPLGARVVVVDEASMIDVVMMDRLLRALGPDTRLVLLGDADQLPSVDAGAVFRDLCALASDGVVRLTHSYRMDAGDPAGRNILKVAQAVHRGRAGHVLRDTPERAADGVTPRARAASLTFSGCEWVEAADVPARAELLARWDEVYLRPLASAARAIGPELVLTAGRPPATLTSALEAVFTHLEAAKLLALTRAGALGVERVNQHFHAVHARDARARYAVGEPVMVHHNDYVRGLFNGDAGVVLSGRFDFERGSRRLVLFRRDDGFIGFPLSAIEDGLELAYAITVHKAQGSEYDAIGVLLPDVETPLLTREILYTAITRARRSVTLVGPRWAIDAAVARRVTRSSGLLARVEEDLQRAAGEARAHEKRPPG